MKFSEMPYTRPELSELKRELETLIQRFSSAQDYIAARTVFLEKEAFERHLYTMETLAHIRHDINTFDVFYDAEMQFWNEAMPELEEYLQAWTSAMLNSNFRDAFAEEFGVLMFTNAEIKKKTFSNDIIPELQQENNLVQTYEKLLASAQIHFEGADYTLSQMTPFKTDPDDARRLAAWMAEGAWYKEHQQELDDLYDQLVHLRDTMSRKLGYDDFRELGYYRMGRNCYGRDDIEQFRMAVQKYLVPVADNIYREQAKRLGKEYPMSFADNALEFRSGNPKPRGTPEEILEQSRKFYDSISPETSAFFRMMLRQDLLDVLSREGKVGGGYCTSLYDYDVPFIFANFNGTKGDIEVVTHEAGHAFAGWLNRGRTPTEYRWPTLEGCEVHSMAMEFFAWPWAEQFFGTDSRKYRYSHLSLALTFIPYGTMVDHFQHIVYEKPNMTPEDRHTVWKELSGTYMPWVRMDSEIPFYSEGMGWQKQSHIYSCPFYYIDYCLAQTVALELWSMMQKDLDTAWTRYMAYTKQGGSRTFKDLLENAGLNSPFDESCLRSVCEAAQRWLDRFDMTGID